VPDFGFDFGASGESLSNGQPACVTWPHTESSQVTGDPFCSYRILIQDQQICERQWIFSILCCRVRYNISVGHSLPSQNTSQELVDKVSSGTASSIYGLNTGFGGSDKSLCITKLPVIFIKLMLALTLTLGSAFLQHQHLGVLPTSTKHSSVLLLLGPLNSTSMLGPGRYVNSLIRGHSNK
jgi:hypothetical protein